MWSQRFPSLTGDPRRSTEWHRVVGVVSPERSRYSDCGYLFFETVMTRALLLLLVLPSLLMPPGTCVCRLLPVTNVSTTTRTSGLTSEDITRHTGNPQPNCSCESCRVRVDDAERDHPVPPTRVPSVPDHLPGCPAAVGAVVLDVIVSPVLSPALDPSATVGIVTPTVEHRPALARVTSEAPPTVDPPLFISHCSLLI